jgi:acetylornithine deacetylase/succinyl-diaminopimelate desuccinylase-like protein
MATRDGAIARVADYFDEGAFKDDLACLVAFETESQNPEQKGELSRYLAEAIRPRLAALGFDCEIFDNPDPRGGPLLVGARIEDPSFETILTYGHGDVILAQTEQWREGLHPFKLVEENGRLYGRGTADNKAQHLINLSSLAAVLAERERLGFNMKVVIETSEETGSPGLADFFREQKDRLAADVLIASDGPRLQPGTPTMFMGSRGGVNFDLAVNLRDGAHHSGNWGGLLANPGIILAHAIAQITTKTGALLIPEWRPGPVPASVAAALARIDVDRGEGAPEIDPKWGEPGLTALEKVVAWNSFEVLAFETGDPANPVNAIPPRATATCHLRYVVPTDPDALMPALRRLLDERGFPMVRLEAEPGPMRATRLDPEHPWVRFVVASIEHTARTPVAVLPNLGGSLPNDIFADLLGLPTIWVPHSHPACSQHAPDEHVLAPVCRQALRIMAGLWWDIGEPDTRSRVDSPA